jgi:hypothetical protein
MVGSLSQREEELITRILTEKVRSRTMRTKTPLSYTLSMRTTAEALFMYSKNLTLAQWKEQKVQFRLHRLLFHVQFYTIVRDELTPTGKRVPHYGKRILVPLESEPSCCNYRDECDMKQQTDKNGYRKKYRYEYSQTQ